MNDLKFDIINKANYNAKKTNPSSNLIPKVETGLSIEEQMKPYIESGQYTEIELQLIRNRSRGNVYEIIYSKKLDKIRKNLKLNFV